MRKGGVRGESRQQQHNSLPRSSLVWGAFVLELLFFFAHTLSLPVSIYYVYRIYTGIYIYIKYMSTPKLCLLYQGVYKNDV